MNLEIICIYYKYPNIKWVFFTKSTSQETIFIGNFLILCFSTIFETCYRIIHVYTHTEQLDINRSSWPQIVSVWPHQSLGNQVWPHDILEQLRGEWQGWWHRKTLSLPPLMGTPKLQLFAQKPLMTLAMALLTRRPRIWPHTPAHRHQTLGPSLIHQSKTAALQPADPTHQQSDTSSGTPGPWKQTWGSCSAHQQAGTSYVNRSKCPQ